MAYWINGGFTFKWRYKRIYPAKYKSEQSHDVFPGIRSAIKLVSIKLVNVHFIVIYADIKSDHFYRRSVISDYPFCFV